MYYLSKKSSVIVILILNIITSCSLKRDENVSNGRNNTDSPAKHEQDGTHNNNTVSNTDIASNKQLQNAKPTPNSMRYDFIGHSVTEGVTDGYFDTYWRYVIEDGDINNISVEEVINDDNQQYIAVLRLKLRGGGNNNDTNRSNYYYDTKVKIRYIYDPQQGWLLDYVNSLGMNIVSDHAYDDLVTMANNSIRSITNNGDISLTVGGQYLKDNVWKKFMLVVPAHGTSAPLYDGVCISYGVDDAVIDFIIR